MKRIHLRATLLGVCLAMISANSTAVDTGSVIDIPYTRYVLDNGLTLIVHEDHKAPIVAVNVWYDVGSADEKPGKTGFAHLFEHLMFDGSENYNDSWHKAFDRVGATGLNGSTSWDRTNYFQVVPKTALDMALWMESDRMGHLLGAIDQEKLDEERGVVKNEKRQREDQPYGKAFLTIFEHMYPEGHPYDNTIIGSMADLDAASLDDVREWFRNYYGAANAVLVVAGDVDSEAVRDKVEKYFGDIASGPPLIKPAIAVARRSEASRMVMQDRVPQARIYKAWPVAPYGNPDLDYLDIATDVLALGKNSRLYKRLVYEDQIATDVSAFVWPRQLSSLLVIIATAQPGGDLDAVENIVDQEIRKFLTSGPTKIEMERSRTGKYAGFLRGAERIGGFGGKSDILASGEVYYGDAGAYKKVQQNIISATSNDIKAAANRWLPAGEFVLEVHPFEDYKTSESTVDRSAGVPQVTGFPEGRFPDHESTTLSNGMQVVLANRPTIPVVDLALLLDAGYAADQFGKPGTASLTMTMLDEGTKTRNALQIADQLDRLGADLGAGSNLDMSSVSLSALKDNLDASLDIFVDVIRYPSFPQKEFDRLKKQQLAGIKREKTQPVSMALRVFPRLLYGDGHAYGLPFTGSGTEESVASLGVSELKAFHATWFKPNNATLVVVGDITMAELKPRLERHFGNWKPGDVPAKNLALIDLPDQAEVYIVDRPDAEQSIIFAGHLTPPKSDPAQLAIDATSQILGAGSTSRINMNLREDKHWSYGASSFIMNAAAQRPFIAYAPVQTDKTAESMAEIDKEISGISSDAAPPNEEELAKIKNKTTLTLPGRWETNGAVLGDIVEMVRFGLPDDHWSKYAETVRALTLADVTAQARRVLQPGKMTWVVVGDRAKIEGTIRALGLGEIRFIDADGNPVSSN